MENKKAQLPKVIGLVALLIILIVSLSYLVITGFSIKEEKTIKIGYISSLSGEAGIWGQSLQKGFDFAVEEINAKGGINGKLIQPVYEDDACDAVIGLNAFKKIVEIDNIKIIAGTVCSSVAMSVAKTTQENRVLYIASGATHPDVTKQGDLIFRLWVSDAYEAKEIAKYATNSLNLESFAIMHMNDNPAGVALKDNFKATIEESGGEITDIESYSGKEKDFKSQIAKMLSTNPEAVYIASSPEQMPLIINQLRDQNFDGVLLVYGPAIVSEGISEKIKNKSEIYYAFPITEKITQFWTNYKSETGKEADVLVAGGYDSMMLIADALKQCGEDNECMKGYILSLRNYITSRGIISFDSTGDVSDVRFEIKSLE